MRRLNARAAPLLRDCLAVARACERLGARDRVQVTNPPISAHIRKHPHTQPPTGIMQICRDFAGSMAQARVSLKIVVSPVRFRPSPLRRRPACGAFLGTVVHCAMLGHTCHSGPRGPFQVPNRDVRRRLQWTSAPLRLRYLRFSSSASSTQATFHDRESGSLQFELVCAHGHVVRDASPSPFDELRTRQGPNPACARRSRWRAVQHEARQATRALVASRAAGRARSRFSNPTRSNWRTPQAPGSLTARIARRLRMSGGRSSGADVHPALGPRSRPRAEE